MNNAAAKLSAMPYIRGNKKRIVSLVISLSMFVILSYLVSYLLSCCREPFIQAICEPYRDMFITCPTVTIENYDTTEEWSRLATAAVLEKTEEIEKIPGITGTVLYRNGSIQMKSVIGECQLPCFLTDNTSDMEKILNYKNAKLVSGRLPEKPGEIAMDSKLMKNNGQNLLNNMSDNYKIVGQFETDYYLAVGLALENENDINIVVFHPDDGKDYVKMIKDSGINLYYVFDYNNQLKSIDEEVGSLSTVEKIVQISAGVLLAICLLVVLSLHIMDRHQEWCLLNSIGYSTGEIYSMALRELLFCFVLAILIGVTFSGITGLLFDTLICAPIGIHVGLIKTSAIPIIAAVFFGIYGCCQIPLFVNISRVCTVDEIE